MQCLRNSLLTLALTLLAATVIQSVAQSKEENKIRQDDVKWSHAAESKDLNTFVSFYADDASTLPFNASIAQGKEQIRQLWSQLMSKPGFGLSFTPTKVEVSKSGDMAYEIGTFNLKLNDSQGNATSTLGKYVVVWRKQLNHEWKAVADIFNTDK